VFRQFTVVSCRVQAAGESGGVCGVGRKVMKGEREVEAVVA